jgi:Lar family restriction alleviation protein
MTKLDPCPFCGGEASFERLGTNRQSCIINCENCGCRLETNETGEWCGEQWNRRKYVLAVSEEPVEQQPRPPESAAPESMDGRVSVPVEVVKNVEKLHFISLLLVLVTGVQAGISVAQLLVRFGIIGGGG